MAICEIHKDIVDEQASIIEPNTQYIISGYGKTTNGSGSIAIYYTDGTSQIKSINLPSFASFTLVSEAGKTIDYIGSSHYSTDRFFFIDIDTFQIEEGTAATEYEPYKSSEQYITLPEGMQLHNFDGITDTIKSFNGDVVLIKNIKEHILQSSDISNVSDGTNITYAVCNYFPNQLQTANIKSFMVENMQAADTLDSTNSIGKYFIAGNGKLLFMLSPGTTLAQAQSALAGKKVLYQLETITVYKNGENGFEVTGDLSVYKNGIIIMQPYLKKAFTYNNGITLPIAISQIDKITDVQGNTYTGTLATDGKTITINSATNGDSYIVYAPIQPKYSLIPQITLSVPANLNAAVNTLNKTTKEHSVRLSEHNAILLGLALENIYQDALLNKVQYGTLLKGDIDIDLSTSTYNYIKKQGKIVQLALTLNNLNLTGNTTKKICIIPEDYRPGSNNNLYFLSRAVTANGDMVPMYVYIYGALGQVNAYLPAGTISTINICATWIRD